MKTPGSWTASASSATAATGRRNGVLPRVTQTVTARQISQNAATAAPGNPCRWSGSPTDSRQTYAPATMAAPLSILVTVTLCRPGRGDGGIGLLIDVSVIAS